MLDSCHSRFHSFISIASDALLKISNVQASPPSIDAESVPPSISQKVCQFSQRENSMV